MILLDGREVKLKILNELKEKISVLNSIPGLAVIQIGEDPASKVYVRNKEKMAKLSDRLIRLAPSATLVMSQKRVFISF